MKQIDNLEIIEEFEENEAAIMKRIFASIAHENRKSRKITQERLSEIVGITDVYLRCIESGKNLPNWLIWLKLCTVLEIDIFDIQKKYIIPYLGLNIKADGTAGKQTYTNTLLKVDKNQT